MKLLTWLGAILAGVFLASTVEPCEVPAQYTHSTTFVENDLVITLATDKANYFAGDPVDFYLGVLNTGPDTISVISGWSPMNIFTVMSDTCLSLMWDCIDASLYFYPETVYFFGEGIRILPGECESRVAHWDGIFWDIDGGNFIPRLPDPGEYTVLAGFYQPVAGEPALNFAIPDDGIMLPISISLPTPVKEITWSRIKARYGN